MQRKTYSPLDLQRLKDGGWTEIEDSKGNGTGAWLREGMNPKYGGNTTGEALENQDKLDIITKYGAFYYAIRDRHGFGYWIGIYRGGLGKPKHTEFDHLTENEARYLVKNFNSQKDYEPIRDIEYTKHSFDLTAIFKEKHGDRYFIVHNQTDLEKVALKIVLERHEENWYYFDYEVPVEPKMSIVDAKKFGMNGVIEAVKREWDSYKYNKNQYEEGIKLKAALEKIVKEQDGATALQFLDEMKDGEYEGFEVIKGEDF